MKTRFAHSHSTIERLEDRRLLSAADLDQTFGRRGIVVINEAPIDLDYQSDRKFLVTFVGGNIRRFNEDGSVDTSFANNGTLDPAIGVRGIAVDSTGKIIAGGSLNGRWALARYNPNGSIDNSFGTSGQVVTHIGDDHTEGASFIELAPGNKIVLAGFQDNDNDDPDGNLPMSDLAVARFNANGSIDTSFSGDGEYIRSGPFDFLTALAVAPDGRIVIAGQYNVGQSTHLSAYEEISPSGQRLSFAPESTSGGPAFSADLNRAAAFWPDNTMVLAESVKAVSNVNFRTPSGARDGTTVVYDPLDNTSFNDSKINDIVVQSDPVGGHPSKIIVAGYSGNRRKASALMRLDRDGTPDATFGFGGSMVIDFKKRKADWIEHAIEMPGGILVAGQIGGNPSDRSGADRYFLARVSDFYPDIGTPGGLPRAAAYFNNRPAAGQTTPMEFQVVYAASELLAASTLGDFDLLVRGPRGYITRARLVESEARYDGRHQIVTYSIPAPGGTWDAADNGRYTVSVRKRQVRDNFNNFVRAGPIGRVNLSIAAASRSFAAAANPALVFSRKLISKDAAQEREEDLLRASQPLC